MKNPLIITFICLLLNASIASAQKEKPLNVKVNIEFVYKKETNVYKPVKNLYLNADQVIRITAEGYTHLTAKIDKGIIIDEGEGFFIIKPDTLGKITLKVYDNTDKNNPVWLAVNEYKVVNAPPIVGLLAGTKAGNITRMKFVSDSILHFSDEDMPYACQYKIVSLKISVAEPGGASIKDVPSDGNKIPIRIRELVESAPKDTKVFFDFIKAKLQPKSFDGFDVTKPTDTGPHLMESMMLTISD